MSDWPDPRRLGVVLFPRFDLLDVTGPLHAFGMLKNVYDQELIGEALGPVESAQGPALHADHVREGLEPPEMLLVPGGNGVRKLVEDDAFIAWLSEVGQAAETVMSVGSGAALLARAGLLDGLPATTTARGFSWVSTQSPRVRWQKHGRFVDAGRVVTAAGVASGLDMALHVITRMNADDVGENVARSLEYVWQRDPTNDPFA